MLCVRVCPGARRLWWLSVGWCRFECVVQHVFRGVFVKCADKHRDVFRSEHTIHFGCVFTSNDASDEGVGADVVIQVTNTGNVPLIMSNPYIKVADESGNILVDEHGNGIFSGPSYLRVGDTGFIYTNGPLPLPSGYAPGNNYLAQGSADLASCQEVHEYPLSNLKISEDSRGVPMVTGTVTNDDAETALLIEITAVFIDNENQTLGVAGALVVDVEPGASRDFEIDGYSLPVGCSMAVISNYDVIAVGAKH